MKGTRRWFRFRFSLREKVRLALLMRLLGLVCLLSSTGCYSVNLSKHPEFRSLPGTEVVLQNTVSMMPGNSSSGGAYDMLDYPGGIHYATVRTDGTLVPGVDPPEFELGAGTPLRIQTVFRQMIFDRPEVIVVRGTFRRPRDGKTCLFDYVWAMRSSDGTYKLDTAPWKSGSQPRRIRL
jgi:hypothetical protein